VASPQAIQQWAGPRRVDRSAYWQRDETAASVLRVAWAGRTSTYDQQDPTLSLPRQLRKSQEVLPDDAAIVAHFYDIESGRKDLADRGHSRAHELFQIPIPRDGGIADLLEEAERPDRRFDAVICESIDRIARRAYIATEIEHRLEAAGVRLLAADEPFTLNERGHKPKATQVLTRRLKQGVAEWYVIELLEKSWGGFEVHTESGYNIGKPCYGYRARHVPHPVPAKRAKGVHKTRLEIHPAEGPVVRKIFEWRFTERLGYGAIAARLNQDLTANPPPTPVDPGTAVGRWTYSNVRDVLTNPKHTGHMVWNRRARKGAGRNRVNPVTEWVWSPEPVHEALVDLETYVQAQLIAERRERSRTSPGLNRHPVARHVYRLRGYLTHVQCGRRLHGKTTHDTAYYVCAPKPGYVPPGHHGAASAWLREDHLIEGLSQFLATRVFGTYRQQLLDASLRDLGQAAQRDRAQRITAARKAIAEAEARSKRLLRNFELIDNPDQEFIRDLNTRRAELHAERAQLQEQLAELEAQEAQAPNPALLDRLPVAEVDLALMPDEVSRRLFESLRLELLYDHDHNQVRCRVTLHGDTIATVQQTARNAVLPFRRPDRAGHRPDSQHNGGAPDDLATFCVAPPEGFEPPRVLVPPTGFEPVHGCESGGDPECRPSRGSSQVIADEGALAREVVRKLGFDPDDRGSLADLAAVGIARLAWRDGPVEDWHAAPQRRISDSEMMRASAAVTRAIRDLLAAELPPPPWPRDPRGGEGGADRVFADIADLLSAPSRCLPDGRTLADLAPSRGDLRAFARHVEKHARWWADLAARHGLHELLLVLACHAALQCRRWWLAPDWPYVISEFARRVDENPGQVNAEHATHAQSTGPPPDAAGGSELRDLLAAGPDRLTAELALYCLRAGLGDLRPADYGRPVPPVPGHLIRALWGHLAGDPPDSRNSQEHASPEAQDD